ncbi:methyltransferase [Streptomyces sp. MMS24-I2-30]|uniref:methyltransferase n=1 Tax=Streptomyces sp. MMS24-I2-30 TaxID=3351564 RepID=UPI0038968A9A
MPAPTPPPGVVMTQLLAGFQVSQALYVVAKLDVCTLLDDGPRTVADLAEHSGVPADPLGRLIRTLTMVGVFRSEGDLVATTPLGALLSRNHPASLAGAAELWMETHYGPFGGLLETVRSGVPGATQYFGKPFFEWLSEDQERSALMTRAMANVTGALREGVFDGYDLPPGRVVADIGGADGSVLVQLIADRPERTGVILDLPPVEPAATAHLAERGLDDRITFTAGDFFESVPAADVYVLSFVLHDWDDDYAVRILESIRKAANPGARLLVLEGVIPPGDTPHMMKMVDLTMLGMLPGRERTEPEFRTLLERAGFTFDGVVPTSTVFSIVEASVD